LDYLSDTFLFYSIKSPIAERIVVDGEEFHHCVHVLRMVEGDQINITDGRGSIFVCEIEKIGKDNLISVVRDEKQYKNPVTSIYLCLPFLKSADRFEFAVEKCTELGITHFIFYAAEKSPKFRVKPERIEKILVSSMKQSLRPFLPDYKVIGSFTVLSDKHFRKVILDQKSDNTLNGFLLNAAEKNVFIIGPEAGLSEREIIEIGECTRYLLNTSRLRSETAAITCAAILTSKI